MTINYTSLLKLAKPVTGTESGTWGDTVNDAITSPLDVAVAGAVSIDVTSGNVTLSNNDGSGSNQARYAILLVIGTPGVSRNIIGPGTSKIYLVKNSSNGEIVVKASATTGVTIPVNTEASVFWNGSDYEIVGMQGPSSSTDNAVVRFDGTTGKVVQNSVVTIADTTGDVAGVGALTASGNLTLSGGTANGVLYLNGSKVATSGSAVTYNGTTFSTSADASVNGLTVGRGAGAVSTNTAVGASALAANTTGGSLTAVGYQAGYSNTTGTNNVIVGYQAGYSNQTGSSGTAVGYQAAYTSTVGNPTAFGYQALLNSTTGAENSAFGVWSLRLNTTGSYNTAVGCESLYSNTTASNNTAVGYQAGYSNTTGQYNTFLGYQAGYSSNRTADTSAFNTTVGYIAGKNLTTGQVNVFIGSRSGSSGANALTGNANTVVGDFAGNVLEGAATNNAFFGQNSGYAITTGSKNTIIGSYGGNQDGLDIRTADNYAVISDGDGNRLLTMANGQTLALDGGAVPNSGTGITFPATQSASSNANTLDDYEEGTWTPAYSSSGASFTHATQIGRYVKIGSLVTAYGYIVCTSVSGTTSNAVTVTGLPFTIENVANGNIAAAIGQKYNIDYPSGALEMCAWGDPNTTTIILAWSRDNTTDLSVTAANVGTSSGFMISINYRV